MLIDRAVSQIAKKFPTAVYLVPALSGFTLELGMGARSQKN